MSADLRSVNVVTHEEILCAAETVVSGESNVVDAFEEQSHSLVSLRVVGRVAYVEMARHCSEDVPPTSDCLEVLRTVGNELRERNSLVV